MLFPRIGRKAWILTDVYEKTCAVPVTVISLEQSDLWERLAAAQGAARPRYAVRWQVCEGRDEYHEDYYLDSRRGLYGSADRALAALRRMERKRPRAEAVKAAWKGGNEP